MEWNDLLKNLTFEYYGYIAATNDDMTFYDFMLARGFNRFQLSAHGIGRDHLVEED